VIILHEPGRCPVAYFPVRDIAPGSLEPTGRTTQHPDLGTTQWFAVRSEINTSPRGAWQHIALPSYAAELLDRVAFAWPAMDAFCEEDERVLGHAADNRGGARTLSMVAASPHASDRTTPGPSDEESRRWVNGLRDGSPHHDQTIAALHALLLRVARHEVHRRRGMQGIVGGAELDDLAQQAADDALMTITSKIGEFRGASRFTTWAYKFVVFEVSGKLARHAWRRQSPAADDRLWDRLPDHLTPQPGARAEQRELLEALKAALATDLTDRQRHVFVAVALNEIPSDLVALELGCNRNAIYKNLFDARRRLRASLAAAGHPLTAAETIA
jgi:RNA polymerase sigma-70 factor (ECF subfamily)